MAEIVSRQAAAVAAGKVTSANAKGKKRVVVITSPTAATWADGSTIASGVKLPPGVRFLCDSFASHADMGASIALDVGIRDWATKTAIDADGIAAAVDVATAAARQALNSGALVKDGAEYVTTTETEVYATLSGGTPTANAQIRIEVSYLSND